MKALKLLNLPKLQMLVFQFERIKILENETFNEFYFKITNLRNSMINLGTKVSDAKLIKNNLRSMLERFRIKVTSIEESKDLDDMKIEELMGSLQTYEFSLPPVEKAKSMALKTGKETKGFSDEESMDDEALALLVKKLKRFLKREKNPHKIQCLECGGHGHKQADCENLKFKGKAYNVILSNDEETSGTNSKFFALAASYNSPYESDDYYYANSESEIYGIKGSKPNV
jgi:hypothetical protein